MNRAGKISTLRVLAEDSDVQACSDKTAWLVGRSITRGESRRLSFLASALLFAASNCDVREKLAAQGGGVTHK